MNPIDVQRIAAIRANNPEYNATSPINHDNKKRDIKDGNTKSMNALKWAGIIAVGALAVGGTIYSLKKGKPLKYEKITDEAGKTVQKVGGKVLTYAKDDSGKICAMLDGQKAEGILKFTTNNGVTLTYNDGILSHAIKKGKDGFSKVYDNNGLLNKAKILLSDGTKNVISCVHDKSTGKILKIKDKINGTTKFSYNDENKIQSITKKGEDLIAKAKEAIAKKNLPGNEWAQSMGDMSEKAVLKSAIEEKIADGQIENVQDAINSGFSEDQLRQTGFYDKLPGSNTSIKITGRLSKELPNDLSQIQLSQIEEIEEKISDGQISNLQDAIDSGYSKDLLKTLGFIM